MPKSTTGGGPTGPPPAFRCLVVSVRSGPRPRGSPWIYDRRLITEPVTVGDITGRLVTWLERLMPAGERRDALVAQLTGRFRDDEAPISACLALDLSS